MLPLRPRMRDVATERTSIARSVDETIYSRGTAGRCASTASLARSLLYVSDVDQTSNVATLIAMTIDPSMALRDVKNRLSEVVDQVEREHHRVVITRHGKPAAVVISADDLASLEETLEVMSHPKLVGQIRDSLRELAQGKAEVLSKDALLATLRT